MENGAVSTSGNEAVSSICLDEPSTGNSRVDIHERLSGLHTVTTEVRPKPEVTKATHKPTQPISDQIWVSIKSWSEVTTFHGIRNIFDENTSLLQRGCWLAIVCGFLFITVFMCQSQLNQFLSYNTHVEVIPEYPELIPLPAVTICSHTLVKNDSVTDQRERTLLSELYLNREPNTTYLVEELDIAFLRNVSLKSILENCSVSAEELLLECYWGGNQISHNKWKVLKTLSGFCITLNSGGAELTSDMTNIAQTGRTQRIHLVLSANSKNCFVNEDSSVGVKVMVHEPSEFPDVLNGISLAPGSTHYIALTKNKYTYLPYPVRAFGDQECFDTTSEQLAQPDSSTLYTVHHCVQRCLFQHVHSMCNCSGPLDEGDAPECDPIQIIECYNPVVANFSSYAQTCHCPAPCEVTEYKTKVSSARLVADLSHDRDDIVQVMIFYESKVIHRHQQVLAVTFEDLWGSFGGFLGIAVGASIITFLEIFVLLLVNGLHYFRSMRNLARDP